jgi:hypothetical protein
MSEFHGRARASGGAKALRSAVRGVLAMALLTAVFATAVTAASATTGNTEYVNGSTGKDANSCKTPEKACQTISHALSVAVAGTTIYVTAGDYPEQLTITKNVSIIGAKGSASPVILDPSTLSQSYIDPDASTPTTTYYIVYASGGVTANLTNITVDGSNAQAQFTSCADDFVGVAYNGASGTMTNTTVKNVELPQADFGCQQGLAIYVETPAAVTAAARRVAATDSTHGAGTRRISPFGRASSAVPARQLKDGVSGPSVTASSKVTMDGVSVLNYDKNGITCDDPGTSCTIVHSTVTGIGPTSLTAQNGIQGYDATSISLKSTSVASNTYNGGTYAATGALIADDVSVAVTWSRVTSNDYNIYAYNDGAGTAGTLGNWSFTHNKATYSTIAGGDGLTLDSTSNPVTVKDNYNLGHNLGDGLDLYGASNVTATGNTTGANTVDGVYVGSTGSYTNATAGTGNVVTYDTAVNNANDGIEASSATSGNTFTHNTLKYNKGYDAQDESNPVANTWSANTCVVGTTGGPKSSPPGLC